MEIIGYLASILIGISLGLIGGGGSILTVPVLVYLLHVDPVQATAYSLFIVGASSLVGAWPKYNQGFVNLKNSGHLWYTFHRSRIFHKKIFSACNT